MAVKRAQKSRGLGSGFGYPPWALSVPNATQRRTTAHVDGGGARRPTTLFVLGEDKARLPRLPWQAALFTRTGHNSRVNLVCNCGLCRQPHEVMMRSGADKLQRLDRHTRPDAKTRCWCSAVTHCLLVVSIGHAAQAECTPKNTTGCPTVPCGPEHNHTVCYPGVCEGLLGKCDFKQHGIQYYCCPTNYPHATYKCINNQCVQLSGGIEKGLCEQACGPARPFSSKVEPRPATAT